MFSRKSIVASIVRVLAALTTVLVLLRVTLPDLPLEALSNTIVISQVYGGGGNSGATYTSDLIELFNRGNTTVNVTGWSVQYASATGSTWQVTRLSGSIAPGQYYLVQEAPGSGGTVNLPTPDALGVIALSATAGKVALVNHATALTGACPTGANVVDLVGFGGANCSEGTPAPALSNATAVIRNGNGCAETDDNSADFTLAAPNPHNSSSPAHFCGGSLNVTISKSAARMVRPGERLTYTLTVANSGLLDNVVITDVVPSNATFAYALDGGVHSQGVVAWTLAAAPTGTHTVRFAVTATDALATILDSRYGVHATGWPTFTTGPAVHTTVGDYIPIHAIQGGGASSPFAGCTVKTAGVVTGRFQGNWPTSGIFNGVYLQDATGDGDPNTSDAIFVNHGAASVSVNVGSVVTVTGRVQEYNEYDDPCPPCETQIRVTNTSDVQVSGLALLPASVMLDPPCDPIAAAANLESLEGMNVALPATSTVVGPTSYETIMVVPGTLGLDRVMRHSACEGMPVGVRHWELYGRIGGANSPALVVGSVVNSINGPLAYTYGNYVVATQAGSPWSVVTSQPLPFTVPSGPAAGANEFTAATFNAYEFDPDGGAIKMTKVVAVIAQLNGPTFLAFQEVSPTGSLPSLVSHLAARGYPYNYAYSHEDAGGHGVALFWRTDRVSGVVTSTAYQGCSVNGSTSSTYDPLNSHCRGIGQYPLFARRPVIVTGTVGLARGNRQVVVIANHFKAKGTAADDQRRLGEGQFVGGLVDYFVSHGSPNVIVMGDLNDWEDSPPLQALYASGNLTSTWYAVPEDARYSFIYKGVSQVLDHILVSQPMRAWLRDVGPLRIDADYPFNPYSGDAAVVWRTSDHDPISARFSVPSAPERPIAPLIVGLMAVVLIVAVALILTRRRSA